PGLSRADDDDVNDVVFHRGHPDGPLSAASIGLPPTHVSSRALPLSPRTGTAVGSAARMAKSATLPGSSDPTRCSWWARYAPPTAYPRSAVRWATPISGP